MFFGLFCKRAALSDLAMANAPQLLDGTINEQQPRSTGVSNTRLPTATASSGTDWKMAFLRHHVSRSIANSGSPAAEWRWDPRSQVHALRDSAFRAPGVCPPRLTIRC